MDKDFKNSHLLSDLNSAVNDQHQLVKINAQYSESGIQMEYDYVSEKYGDYGRGWTLIKQRVSSVELENGKRVMVDTLFIRLTDDSTVSIKFDITSFYGKCIFF
jgi:hypothetical protein